MLASLLLAALPAPLPPVPQQAAVPGPVRSITQTGRTPTPGTIGLSLGTPSITRIPVGAGTMFPGIKGQTTLWKLTLSDPAGTGFNETFLLQVPPAAAYPAPLLVAFHAYGVSQNDIPVHTTYPEECAQRGWFLLAPLGASKVSFSCLESQANTAFVLDLLSSLWPTAIDRTRVYGVGFSMGGGNALNYAARHLDPTRTMFAAVANHTGTVAQINSYYHDPAVQWIYEFWYGGNPLVVPFEYQRASLLNYDTVTLAVDQETDLARNLTHVPVRSTYASLDPLKHLIEQTQVFHGQLSLRGGDSTLVALGGFGHTWTTLNETITCDWLASHVLQLPTAAETLAEHDGRYFHFDVAQDAPGAFTPFTWDGDAAANRLTLSATKNLARLSVDDASLGLDTALPLEVVLSTADGLADEVELKGYAASPSTVTRDAAPTASWSWDSGTATLLLLESDGAATHTWQIVP